MSIVLANMPSPLGNHILLLLLRQQVEHERLVKVEDQENVEDSDSVLVGQRSHLPESVAEGIFEESCDVLERSPSLGSVARFLRLHNELGEITVGFLGEGTANHISSLVHVGVTVHETFDTHESLSEMRLRVLSIVEVLRHFYQ